MSLPRFNPKIKDVAVCQVTERGHFIAEVSVRTDVLAHVFFFCV